VNDDDGSGTSPQKLLFQQEGVVDVEGAPSGITRTR
jgi:hypothetical protein